MLPQRPLSTPHLHHYAGLRSHSAFHHTRRPSFSVKYCSRIRHLGITNPRHVSSYQARRTIFSSVSRFPCTHLGFILTDFPSLTYTGTLTSGVDLSLGVPSRHPFLLQHQDLASHRYHHAHLISLSPTRTQRPLSLTFNSYLVNVPI